MFLAVAEVVLIITGITGVIGSIAVLLGILTSGRRTSTHLYIMYMAVLSLLQQFVSPIFHHAYIDDFYQEFNLREFLSLMFVVLTIGIVLLLMLLFFMDYIPMINTSKIVVMIVHFTLTIGLALIYYFVVERYSHIFIIVAALIMIALIFLLLFVLHRDLDCLINRKQTDDESRLRYLLVLMFICSKIVSVITFLLESFISVLIIGFPSLGFVAVALFQMDSVLFCSVLFRVDNRFRSGVLGLFKMCCSRPGKVQFQNLDNGRLINQEV